VAIATAKKIFRMAARSVQGIAGWVYPMANPPIDFCGFAGAMRGYFGLGGM
jgi:hypothetical protein